MLFSTSIMRGKLFFSHFATLQMSKLCDNSLMLIDYFYYIAIAIIIYQPTKPPFSFSHVALRIGTYVGLLEEGWPLPLLLRVLDDEVELVEVWQLHLDFIIALDQLDCLIRRHEPLLHHFCLLKLQPLQLLLTVVQQPLLYHLHLQRLLHPISRLRYNPLPALQNDTLVLCKLRVPIFSPFLLDDLIGDESVQRSIAAFEDLLIGVNLADFLLDII